MVIASLKSVLDQNRNLTNKDFIRNLLKEELQVYVLNFIYTSVYKDLIFTGGTCLRRFYGLPRISEDLDLDINAAKFDFLKFEADLERYFRQGLQYKNLKSKFKNQTVFLQFPVLKEIGFSGPAETDILFLRVDFAFNRSQNFGVEKHLFSASDFSFLVKAYDFPTLLANKISAFLARQFKKGKEQTEPFKGRDVFDLAWMLQETKKTKQKVNLKRVADLTGIGSKSELKKAILTKAGKIDSKALYDDLKSFFADLGFVEDFCQNFQSLLESNLKYL